MDLAKKVLVVVASGIIGACILLTYVGKFPSYNYYRILYVAEDELVALERDRVKDDNPSTRQLFFGKIEKAVSLAVTLPKSYESPTSIVVYSASIVRGENVRSISSEIHSKIISELQKNE
jgi:hypothetical protein